MNLIYVISDVHLGEHYPKASCGFLKFLSHCQQENITSLYILGDLFDVWVGDDVSSAIAIKVAKTIKSLVASGTNVYFQHGNRDFMLGKKYAQTCGMKLLDDKAVCEGVLMMHGDLLCTSDKHYQRYRSVVQHALSKWLITRLPIKWRINMGQKMRANSKVRNDNLNASKMDVTNSAVMQAFEQSGVNTLIHGHTHQPATHQYGDKRRLVLGMWEEDVLQNGVDIAVLDDNGCRLEKWRPQ